MPRKNGKTLTAAQASRALGISLDTLRRWDREGKIRVERDTANRRVVPVSEVERLDSLDVRHHDMRGNPAPFVAKVIDRIDRLKDEMVTASEYLDRHTEWLRAQLDQTRHGVELAAARARLLTTLGLEVR